jgi:O-methyltransferase
MPRRSSVSRVRELSLPVSARRSVGLLRIGVTRARRAVRNGRAATDGARQYPPDFDRALVHLIERVRPYTVTSPERLAALVSATEHVDRARVPGAIVECGVWRGGSMMAVALALLRRGAHERELYLFDTYAGMTEPTACDVETFATVARSPRASDTWRSINDWCAVGLQEVRANLLSTGYPAARLHFVEGKVEETLPAAAPERIALLRLDTDWYESTAHELRELYPRLSAGGILLIDDYGHWSGARKAVDEYFGGAPPFLHRVDYTARVAVKP